MKNWILKRIGGNYVEMGSALSVDPVLVRILANRGVRDLDGCRAFLNPSADDFNDSALLKDADKACEIIKDFIVNEKHIRIIGDYDVDGVMSTYILYSALENLGAFVSYAIPNRVEDGYGMSINLVNQAHEDGVDLIITCDNGIAAMGAINQALDYGITVVVTDHHQVPFMMMGQKKVQTLPLAAAVVNPHRDDDEYPLKNICGAVVAYKLMDLLYRRLGKDHAFIDNLLQFAAFATVCDVMPLIGENRAIVTAGLRQMENTQNIGLRALIDRQGLSGVKLTTYQLGFVLGPCINASGRLADATKSLSLLTTLDPMKAVALADELVSLNEQRKSLTQSGDEEAKRVISENGISEDKVMVVYIPTLHESICGLVASHIRREYYRPVIVLCNTSQFAKGSARSIPAYDMFEELSKHKDMLLNFGGHSQAAGLSLNVSDIERFRTLLNESSSLTEDDLVEVVKIDVDMPLSYINIRLVEQLNMLEPCGEGNPEPLFAQLKVPVLSINYIGKEKKYLKFVFGTGNAGGGIEGILFSDPENFKKTFDEKNGIGCFESYINGKPLKNAVIDIIYKPSINEFRGERKLQIIVEDYK